MTKIFKFGGVFFALLMCSQFSISDEIPPELVKHLKPFRIDESSLGNGVLRVRINASVINQDTLKALARASCYPLWFAGKKDGWAKARIDRVEVINQIGAQGFAFVGGRKSCSEWGNLNGGNENAYIASHTWVCVAGNPCRPRRDGEITSGD